ncbi:SMI1/KNR4 family protein [Chromobacterium sp. Beijing]|uniref:SMI1/KNR4 family protein n=1 Tax=Chromobacterium sp. Beijing TaxID=2735795 RepID=UPI001F1948A8|nr:SMI1/KNR4 family protein [Chromobacterium sp. Beijing]UJB32226.1 SMI1/KNR4 family protein [Chromobacterium sp. Beijing]
MTQYLPLGISLEELNFLIKNGVKLDKRKKQQMLQAYSFKERPSATTLIDFFGKLDISPAQDYLEFLSKYNGGKPEPSSIKIKTKSISIQYFYAHSTPLASCTLDYAITMHKGRIPLGYIPIAHDSSGSLLLLSCTGDNKGEVYYWDHNDEADCSAEPFFGNMAKVATSFTDLDRMFQ